MATATPPTSGSEHAAQPPDAPAATSPPTPADPTASPDEAQTPDATVKLDEPLCVEVKWPIDAITWSEVARIDRTITSAATQAARLRHELEAGQAEVKMPEGWPLFENIDWTWCVGTAQQLTTVPIPVDNVHATSLRYLLALGTPTDLETLSKLLRDPSLPRYGRDFTKGRKKTDVDSYSLDVEAIVLLTRGWVPTY